MKKIIFAILLCFSIQGFAQIKGEHQFHIGGEIISGLSHSPSQTSFEHFDPTKAINFGYEFSPDKFKGYSVFIKMSYMETEEKSPNAVPQVPEHDEITQLMKIGINKKVNDKLKLGAFGGFLQIDNDYVNTGSATYEMELTSYIIGGQAEYIIYQKEWFKLNANYSLNIPLGGNLYSYDHWSNLEDEGSVSLSPFHTLGMNMAVGF